MPSWDKTDHEQAHLALNNAASLLIQATHLLARARYGLEEAQKRFAAPPFTKQQALTEAKAKVALYGDLGKAALQSLIKDWEAAP